MNAILRYTIAFLVLPTLLFMGLETRFFIIRGLIDLDYLLAGVLLPFLGAWVAGLVLVLALLFDLLLAFAPAFHFRGGGFFESVEYVFDIQLWYVLAIAGATLLGACLYAGLSLRIVGPARSSKTAGLAMLALIPLLVLADGLTSGNALMKSDGAETRVNLATSSTFETIRSGYRWLSYTVHPVAPPIAAATDPIRARLDRPEALPQQIVVVVSESMGVFREDAANDIGMPALLQPQLSERYEIERGTVPFFSSTVPGELRELCGVLKRTTAPRPDELPMADCLPHRLAALGYRTVAAHGFAASFFNRQRWYPLVGFQELRFGEDFDAVSRDKLRCGVAFRGICDDLAMDVLRTDLQAHLAQRNLIYWLTLNAHTPYPEPRDRYGRVDCSASQATREHPEFCRLAGIYHIVLSSVIETALQPWADDAAFIIVGDHAPPFVRAELREHFDPERVPYVILWPKARGPLRAGMAPGVEDATAVR